MLMTGRELIIYILENNLEDKQIFENGKLIGYMTVEQAAIKFSVGTAAVKQWLLLGWMPFVEIAGESFIPINAELIPKKITHTGDDEK